MEHLRTEAEEGTKADSGLVEESSVWKSQAYKVDKNVAIVFPRLEDGVINH